MYYITFMLIYEIYYIKSKFCVPFLSALNFVYLILRLYFNIFWYTVLIIQSNLKLVLDIILDFIFIITSVINSYFRHLFR